MGVGHSKETGCSDHSPLELCLGGKHTKSFHVEKTTNGYLCWKLKHDDQKSVHVGFQDDKNLTGLVLHVSLRQKSADGTESLVRLVIDLADCKMTKLFNGGLVIYSPSVSALFVTHRWRAQLRYSLSTINETGKWNPRNILVNQMAKILADPTRRVPEAILDTMGVIPGYSLPHDRLSAVEFVNSPFAKYARSTEAGEREITETSGEITNVRLHGKYYNPESQQWTTLLEIKHDLVVTREERTSTKANRVLFNLEDLTACGDSFYETDSFHEVNKRKPLHGCETTSKGTFRFKLKALEGKSLGSALKMTDLAEYDDVLTSLRS